MTIRSDVTVTQSSTTQVDASTVVASKATTEAAISRAETKDSGKVSFGGGAKHF